MTIMKLYPDAAPEEGKWVVIKCDSGPGRLNAKLLAYMRFNGFLLFPGVSNTTAVTQEKDQNCGPFQSDFQYNLQMIIDARIDKGKSTSLAPWMVGLIVFGGEDPETGAIIRSALQEGFNPDQCRRAWEKCGAVPPNRNSLTNNKV